MNIEMEITLRCNAECPSCSRHCHYGLYDERSDVTIDQVDRFCEEVKGHGDIDMISIMGGEPTLHPKLITIVQKVAKLRRDGHIKRFQVVSNGIDSTMVEHLRDMEVQVCVSRPEEKGPKHRCMFVAPVDTGQKLKNCPVPKDCGVSWGAFGWFPCGAGGAIARLLNMPKWRKNDIPEDILPQSTMFGLCQFCQAKAETYMFVKDFGEIQSVSFRWAFESFDVNRLRRY